MQNKNQKVLIILVTISSSLILLIYILIILNTQIPQSFVSINDFLAIQDMNNTIQISDFPSDNSGIDKNQLSIELINRSHSHVKFPIDWGVKIYTYQGYSKQWIEIKNLMSYTSYNNNYPKLDPTNDANIGSKTLIDIIPDLPDNNLPITIRVFVTGRVLKKFSLPGEYVAAYVDIAIYH